MKKEFYLYLDNNKDAEFLISLFRHLKIVGHRYANDILNISSWLFADGTEKQTRKIIHVIHDWF